MAQVRVDAEPLLITAAGSTDAGRVRDQNEDHVLVEPALGLFAVADGVGGHQRGDVASAIAVAALKFFFEATAGRVNDEGSEGVLSSSEARRLGAAVRRANRSVWEVATTSERFRSMATTIVAAYYAPGSRRLYLAHVGDSRCYRARAGKLEQLTRDHSLRNDARALRPDLTPAQIAKLPQHVVTRALGVKPTVMPDERAESVHDGDVYLLCSDGLSDLIEGEELCLALEAPTHPSATSRALVALANRAGGGDNISALVLRVGGGFAPEPPAPSDSAPEIIVTETPLLLSVDGGPEITVTIDSSPNLLAHEATSDAAEIIAAAASEVSSALAQRAAHTPPRTSPRGSIAPKAPGPPRRGGAH